MRQRERIADSVLLLHMRRAPAVLEVVTLLLAHIGVADAAKIDPDMRELVDEERPGVEIVDAVDRLPLVGAAPRGVGVGTDRMRRRAERQQIEDERLVVAFPAEGEKAGFRLGPPAVAKSLPALEHPVPLDAFEEHLREGA